jgi:predicted DNA-binding mobile mystery protein A
MADKLRISQIDRKLQGKIGLAGLEIPSTGWIRSIRNALGMTLLQLSSRMGSSPQGLRQLEKRESEGSITLNSLKDVAEAMDMKLVYALIPKDGSLEELINKRAEVLAAKIVMRTSQSMKLEDQENESSIIKKAIKERKEELLRDMPKTFWN